MKRLLSGCSIRADSASEAVQIEAERELLLSSEAKKSPLA